MIDDLTDLVASPELWAGVAAGLVSIALLVFTHRRDPELALAFAIGVAIVACGVATVPIVAVLALTAFAVTATRGALPSIIASAGAAFAAYVCVPDTERALVVLGSVLAVGLGAAVRRWRWNGAGTVTSVALALIAVTDGRPRTSAVVGTLGVVAIHQLLQLLLPDRRHPALLLVVGLGTMIVSARVAGLGSGLARPVVVALACLGVTAAVGLVSASASSLELGEEPGPPRGDGGE